MKNLFYKKIEKLFIWTKKKYVVFTSIISKPNVKKIVYLRLANLEKDNEDKKKRVFSLMARYKLVKGLNIGY